MDKPVDDTKQVEADKSVEDKDAQNPQTMEKKPEGFAELMVYFRKLGPAGILAVLAMSLPAIGGFALLGFMPVYGDWLQSLGGWGLLIYISTFAVASGLAFLPTYAQAVVGGFVFGITRGSIAAISGYLGGAIIGYTIARFASGDRVMNIIDEKPKWRCVYDALISQGRIRALVIITLLRLPPNSPFAITNLVMAGTKINPLIFIIGTLVGMAPRTIIAVYFGAGIEQLSISDMRGTSMFIISLVLAVIVLGIIGTLANKALARLTNEAPQEDQGGTEI